MEFQKVLGKKAKNPSHSPRPNFAYRDNTDTSSNKIFASQIKPVSLQYETW